MSKIIAFFRNLALNKRGITTSEFWVTGITIVTTLSGLNEKQAIVIGVIAAAYVISRGLTKIN